LLTPPPPDAIVDDAAPLDALIDGFTLIRYERQKRRERR